MLGTYQSGESFAQIKVIGVGGGGSNVVNRMMQADLPGIDFTVVNTDAQALLLMKAPHRLQIGDVLTHGLGAGGNPQVGARAAEESREELLEVVKGADMVFITVGMGGGTGTGAAPVIAKLAKEAGVLTVAVVTRPFTFEGNRRRKVADEGLQRLYEQVDTLIVIPNDRLLAVSNKKTSLTEAFSLVDDVLCQGIQGIAELITVPGLINLDFADVRTVMTDAGTAMMGMGFAQGENRAAHAAQVAIESPLLDVDMSGARGVLFMITGSSDLTLFEVTEAAEVIRQAAHPEANIIFGAVQDQNYKGYIKVTVIATGFEQRATPGTQQGPQGEFPLPVFKTSEVPTFLRRP